MENLGGTNFGPPCFSQSRKRESETLLAVIENAIEEWMRVR